jgi:N6-adenosine-specific RNA methylase IME4
VKRYRTIVADPPWEMKRGSNYAWRRGLFSGEQRSLDYPTLSVTEVAELPIANLADDDAHLFLWTTQRHLEATPSIARAWGFTPACTLVWCKPPHGWGPGGAFQSTVEFVIYANRGARRLPKQVPRQWWEWPRGEHSAKPDAFLDMVEQHFPAPRLELFARRARFGWDYWGDQSLGTVEMLDDATSLSFIHF